MIVLNLQLNTCEHKPLYLYKYENTHIWNSECIWYQIMCILFTQELFPLNYGVFWVIYLPYKLWLWQQEGTPNEEEGRYIMHPCPYTRQYIQCGKDCLSQQSDWWRSLARWPRLSTITIITKTINIWVCKIKNPSLALTNILLLFVVYFQSTFDGDERNSTLINTRITHNYFATISQDSSLDSLKEAHHMTYLRWKTLQCEVYVSGSE
jgi:hypothetical protein